jgi:hypothetical protein
MARDSELPSECRKEAFSQGSFETKTVPTKEPYLFGNEGGDAETG